MAEPGSTPPPRALIVDYGGVLTNPLSEAVAQWLDVDGIDREAYAEVMRELLGSAAADDARINPVHALERGEVSVPDFEREFAAKLTTVEGHPVPADGLIDRMFTAFTRHDGMHGVLARVKRSGAKTALLSNSWGNDYPREGWEGLFDVVVISGEVGMRKPEPEIYRHTAELLSLRPQECVFVDDLGPNVKGAVDVGMIGVRHHSLEETVAELETLFGLVLADTAP